MFCTLHQWRISQALDEGRELPASLARHLDACPACSAFARAAESMGRPSGGVELPLDSVLRNRILRACRSASPAPMAARRRSILPLTATCLAAAALVAALGVFLSQGSDNPTAPPEPVAQTVPAPDASALLAAALIAADRIRLDLPSPLEQEARRLAQTGKSMGLRLLDGLPGDLILTDESPPL